MAEERCARTDLPKSMCAHCLGHDEPDPTVDYELQGIFRAKFNGECSIVREHRIIKGDEISEVAPTDRMTGARLFACRGCTKRLRKRREQSA